MSEKNNVLVDTEIGKVPERTKIPQAYAALGVRTGYEATPPDELRMFITGPSNEGKTTFVSSMPGALILDFEKGANMVPSGVAARITVTNYDTLTMVINRLVDDAKNGIKPFTRIVFDTFDEFVGLIQMQLAKEKNVEDITNYGDGGHGWSLVRNRAWSFVRKLDQAGYPRALVGHLTMKTRKHPVTKQDVTTVEPLIFDSFAKLIIRNSDLYCQVYCIPEEKEVYKSYAVGDGKTKKVQTGVTKKKAYYMLIRTVVDEGREGKTRGVPTLKDKIRLPEVSGYQAFASEYDKAVEDTKKKWNIK